MLTPIVPFKPSSATLRMGSALLCDSARSQLHESVKELPEPLREPASTIYRGDA
ncbi:hypothetical protein ACQY0O_008148 [Thecaphora frezii]